MLESKAGRIYPFPSPDYPMKTREREMFHAEQTFLFLLPGVIFPDVLDSQTRTSLFLRYISDLSSTEMAEQTFSTYGLTGRACLSNKELSREANISNHSIDTNTRVVMQSLWLLHGISFHPDLLNFSKKLSERYLKAEEQPGDTLQKKVLQRAQRNISYYKDRLFIMENEEEVLRLLEGMYGKRTCNTFARFYRLMEYKETENIERQGNFTFQRGDSQERLQLEDVLEAGRATTEYVFGLTTGSKSWTSIKGVQLAGYRRKGTHFGSVLREYQQQVKVAQALQNPDIRKILGSLQTELLELTTEARLSGFTKQDGLDQFNNKYHTQYDLANVKTIERHALLEHDENRLGNLDRKEKLKKLLKSESLKSSLAISLADLIFNYHIEGHTIFDIAEQLTIHPYVTGDLKRFLDRQVLAHFGDPTALLPRRGEISEEMIDAFFKDDKLPLSLEDILKGIANTNNLPVLAFSLFPNWPGQDHAFEALRELAVKIVEKNQVNP